MKPIREVTLPNEIPGHLSLRAMPGRDEPLADAWAQIQQANVTAIVCLSPLDEIRKHSPDYAAEIEERSVPCQLWRFPICDGHGPDDDQAFSRFATRIAEVLRQGGHILIHCAAGIGRTGMLAEAVLRDLGLPEETARASVKKAGSGPETDAQRDALRRVAELTPVAPLSSP